MLGPLIASVVSGEATATVARARRALVVYAAAGVLLLCGAGFLLVAAFLAVADEIGSIPAALWFGGGFVLVALILILSHRVSARVRAKHTARRRQTEMRAVASTAAIALLPTLLASRGRTLALLVPALAGLGWAVWRENAPRRRRYDRDLPK